MTNQQVRQQKRQQMPQRMKPLIPKGRVLSRLEYAFFVGLFSIVYGAFFFYATKYINIIYDDIINFRLTFNTKVAGVLGIACIIVWFIVFAGTVWRGRDIGFAKWQSVICYLLPCMPRFFSMFFGLDEFDNIIEPLSSFLWLIVASAFLYLPTDWYTKRKYKRPSKVPEHI